MIITILLFHLKNNFLMDGGFLKILRNLITSNSNKDVKKKTESKFIENLIRKF